MSTRITDLTLPYIEHSSGAAPGTPIIVLIHGRGADASDLVDLSSMIGPGYRYLFPDAPRDFEPMPGYRFGRTWFDGLPPEAESFRKSLDTLVRWLEEIAARYETPTSRMLIGGFSQGGVMSLGAGFRIEPPPAGIVAMSGAFNEVDAPDLSSRRDVPVCIVHGTTDDILPVNYARRARAVLEEAGIEVDYGEYDMAHHVTLESMTQVRHFIERVLPLPE